MYQNNYRKNGTEKDTKNDVFIGGLTAETTENALREYFSKYGDIVSISLKTDIQTGQSRGYGFIRFRSQSPVQQLLDSEHHIGSQKIDVKRVTKKDNRLDCKIFVGGLSQEMTEQTIRTFFSQFGNITEYKRPFDKVRNVNKNFCFLAFEDAEDVKHLLTNPKQNINGKDVEIRKVRANNAMPNQSGLPMVEQGAYGYEMPGYPGYVYPGTATAAYAPSAAYGAYGAYGYGSYPGYDYSSTGYMNTEYATQDYYGGKYKDSTTFRPAPY